MNVSRKNNCMAAAECSANNGLGSWGDAARHRQAAHCRP